MEETGKERQWDDIYRLEVWDKSGVDLSRIRNTLKMPLTVKFREKPLGEEGVICVLSM